MPARRGIARRAGVRTSAQELRARPPRCPPANRPCSRRRWDCGQHSPPRLTPRPRRATPVILGGRAIPTRPRCSAVRPRRSGRPCPRLGRTPQSAAPTPPPGRAGPPPQGLRARSPGDAAAGPRRSGAGQVRSRPSQGPLEAGRVNSRDATVPEESLGRCMPRSCGRTSERVVHSELHSRGAIQECQRLSVLDHPRAVCLVPRAGRYGLADPRRVEYPTTLGLSRYALVRGGPVGLCLYQQHRRVRLRLGIRELHGGGQRLGHGPGGVVVLDSAKIPRRALPALRIFPRRAAGGFALSRVRNSRQSSVAEVIACSQFPPAVAGVRGRVLGATVTDTLVFRSVV
jgi:hypothetical protein